VPGLIAAIREYDFIPHRLAPASAGLLISGESVMALAYLTRIGFGFVVPGTLVLLSIAFAVTARSLQRGEQRPCLCFGTHQNEPVGISSLVRIAVLWLATGTLGVLSYGLVTEHAGSSVYGRFESFMLAALVVSLAAWCLSLSRLWRAVRIVRS
jgi:hypothetical protein